MLGCKDRCRRGNLNVIPTESNKVQRVNGRSQPVDEVIRQYLIVYHCPQHDPCVLQLTGGDRCKRRLDLGQQGRWVHTASQVRRYESQTWGRCAGGEERTDRVRSPPCLLQQGEETCRFSLDPLGQLQTEGGIGLGSGERVGGGVKREREEVEIPGVARFSQ